MEGKGESSCDLFLTFPYSSGVMRYRFLAYFIVDIVVDVGVVVVVLTVLY